MITVQTIAERDETPGVAWWAQQPEGGWIGYKHGETQAWAGPGPAPWEPVSTEPSAGDPMPDVG